MTFYQWIRRNRHILVQYVFFLLLLLILLIVGLYGCTPKGDLRW